MAGKPLHLIREESPGRFAVGEEALAALRALEGPVGVISVCGRARQARLTVLLFLSPPVPTGGPPPLPLVRFGRGLLLI